MTDFRTTPHLSVRVPVLRRNIEGMARFAAGRGMALRPHAKTHKSLDVARLQVAAGARGLTVATLGEAEVFARGGFGDLFVAYPLWLDDVKARRMRALLDVAELRLGVDSVEGARRMAAAAGADASRLRVRVEVDSGHHRSGTTPARAGEVAAAAAGAGLAVEGVFTFPGHGYGPGNAARAAADESAALSAARDAVLAEGLPCPVLSGGSTPTAHHASGSPATELRPGVYVFNDAQQLESGTCGEEAVALTAVCTVVGSRGGTVLVDAGSKVLGADRPAWTSGFGRVAGHPLARVVALSEHHATIDWGTSLPVPVAGDLLRVIPNHVCNAVNLVDELVASEDGFDAIWPVHARGRNS
ncbi:MAG: alanine racemase [Arthrobacter sp.]|uniref:alanine racemase n=1 Tax=Arthrobacter sp. TaxID=1667 RepID=UPI00346C6649